MFKRKDKPTQAAAAASSAAVAPYEAELQAARDLVAEYQEIGRDLLAAHKATQRTVAALKEERAALQQRIRLFDESVKEPQLSLAGARSAADFIPFETPDEYTAALFRVRALATEIDEAEHAATVARFEYSERAYKLQSDVEAIMIPTLKSLDSRRAELKAEFDRLRLTR